MEVTKIKYLKRIQTAPYEHEELELEATLAEGEVASQAILQLMATVQRALSGDLTAAGIVTAPVETATTKKAPLKVVDQISGAEATINFGGAPSSDTLENGQAIPSVIPEKKTAPRKGKAAAVTEAAAPVETPSEDAGGASDVAGSTDSANVTKLQPAVSKAAAPVAKGIVVYDTSIKEHRSRFATFLGQAYPSWKTAQPVEKIKEFSLGLHGKPFEDAKGNMLEGFKAELKDFFGKK